MKLLIFLLTLTFVLNASAWCDVGMSTEAFRICTEREQQMKRMQEQQERMERQQREMLEQQRRMLENQRRMNQQDNIYE